MATHWFLVWVPSSSEERKEREESWSRSRTTSGARREDSGAGVGDLQEGSDTGRESVKSRFELQRLDSSEVGEKSSLPTIKEDVIINGQATQHEEDENELLQPLVEREIGDKNCPNATSSTLEPSSEHLTCDKTICSKELDFLVEQDSLEERVSSFLATQKIGTVHVVQTVDKKKTQISFCIPFDQVEGLSLQLQSLGVGHTEESSVSILPISLHCSMAGKDGVQMREEEAEVSEAKVEKFYSTIKSRLLVSEVVARIEAGAEFSFDYLALVILAGIIAFMGLLENSSVVLVASMLVSPIMGPILAGIFGGVIGDRSLAWRGVRHEIYSLGLCILIGFLLGLVVALVGPEIYGCSHWPTSEMLGRTTLRSLWVGVLIAIPSGAGVALSVLGGNAGSLVGVAISASLLPPAVNCGIFWALSAVMAAFGNQSWESWHSVNDDHEIVGNSYVPSYVNDNLPLESFFLGCISLVLTLVNIICIILTGVCILRIKEVTPEKVPQKFQHFWKEDIRAHRNYNHKIKKDDPDASKLIPASKTSSSEEALEGTFLQSMFERVAQDEELINIRQWVAMPGSAMVPQAQDPYRTYTASSHLRVPQLVLPGPSSPPVLSSPSSHSSPPSLPQVIRARDSYVHFHPQDEGLHRRSMSRTRASSTGPPATSQGQGPAGGFLDVSTFLQRELRRSRDVRRKLRQTEAKSTV